MILRLLRYTGAGDLPVLVCNSNWARVTVLGTAVPEEEDLCVAFCGINILL